MLFLSSAPLEIGSIVCSSQWHLAWWSPGHVSSIDDVWPIIKSLFRVYEKTNVGKSFVCVVFSQSFLKQFSGLPQHDGCIVC